MKHVRARLLEDLRYALEELESNDVVAMTRRLMMTDVSPAEVIEQSLLVAMQSVSRRFDDGEIFIPQLLLAADAFEQAICVLAPSMDMTEHRLVCPGKVLVYTVEGDIHDIGKNIMAYMFRANGFSVCDLGRNVPADRVVSVSREWMPDVIIGFALMTTTYPAQRELISRLTEEGLRDRFRVLVGGALASRCWAEEIGADGYAADVMDATRMARKMAREVRACGF